MLAEAVITVDLAKIAENTRLVVDNMPGVSVVGVTKMTCGTPEIAAAMLAGGAEALGESRLENVERLRAAGVTAPMWLLREPPPALADDVVRLTDVSLASEVVSVRALDAAAAKVGRRHSVVAMVDIGDLREGMMPFELPRFVDAVEALEHVELLGLGASLTCYGAIVPSRENLGLLAQLAEQTSDRVGRPMLVSGGSSTSIELIAEGRAPSAIDSLRVGEAIVLGVDPASRERIDGLHTDAVRVAVPVIECRRKPSVPIGVPAQDAFGNRPAFEDRGERMRAICALGRQDAPPQGLVPADPRVCVLGASSDHLILDVEELGRTLEIGEAVEFVPSYGATLGLFTSPYVRKEFVG
jgi:predicted amino acid racemase